MSETAKKASNPASSREITRAYFDSLLLEQRLMDSGIPNTRFTLYGTEFSTPIMTAALSHIGTFNPDMPDGMTEYAREQNSPAQFIGLEWEARRNLFV